MQGRFGYIAVEVWAWMDNVITEAVSSVDLF